jgi:hypothetical protein
MNKGDLWKIIIIEWWAGHTVISKYLANPPLYTTTN